MHHLDSPTAGKSGCLPSCGSTRDVIHFHDAAAAPMPPVRGTISTCTMLLLPLCCSASCTISTCTAAHPLVDELAARKPVGQLEGQVIPHALHHAGLVQQDQLLRRDAVHPHLTLCRHLHNCRLDGSALPGQCESLLSCSRNQMLHVRLSSCVGGAHICTAQQESYRQSEKRLFIGNDSPCQAHGTTCNQRHHAHDQHVLTCFVSRYIAFHLQT